MSKRLEEEDDRLLVGDALAREILDALAPLRFTEATGEGEREECFRLRYAAVRERAMADSERFPHGMERDDFDEAAIQILGWDGHIPIATCRVLTPASDRVLPIQTEFGIQLTAAGGIAEWGRLVVDPGYRGDGHSVILGLAAQGWMSMRDRGYSRVIAATTGRLIALFEALGFSITRLGPPREYWREERFPILFDGGATALGVEQEWLANETQVSRPPEQRPADR